MFIQSASVGPWGTNCHVVATKPGAECIVIDPGLGALQEINSITQENHLKPVAVLLTHGHIDHIWNLLPLCDDLGIPAVIHQMDKRLLKDPLMGVSKEAAEMVNQLSPGAVWREPAIVQTMNSETKISFAGFEIDVIPTPGHTAGSVCFLFNNDHLFTGDTLFAQGIGRTDLFSGSDSDMVQSLNLLVNRFDDNMIIYPGHGPNSSIGETKTVNSYLQKLLDLR